MANKLNRFMYQDKASGIWYFQKKAPRIEKPYKLSLETKSVVEARRKRDELLRQIVIHGFLQSDVPEPEVKKAVFGEVAQKWAEIAKTGVEETTFDGYKKVMNAHVLPCFGNKPIASITALEIETFISKLTCTKKTKVNILTPFKLIMKFAKKHNFIQANPFVDVDPIKKALGGQKNKEPLDLDEIARLIEALDDYWRPLFMVLFFSGMRIGEVVALQWKHVDFQAGKIKIRRSLIRRKGGEIIFKQPKTEGSIRDVDVPDFVIGALREQRKRTWKGDEENLVFVNKAGRPVHRHTLNQAVLSEALKKAGINSNMTVKDGAGRDVSGGKVR